MTNSRELQKGDKIRCKDAEDAANTAIELGKQGYLWDFEYHYGPLGTKHYVVIEGREENGAIN